MTTVVLSARDVAKRHGPLEVLRGISMDVKQGEVAVVLGPSGGGKSTFLRCLNGLETFDAGEVRVGENALTATTTASERNRTLAKVRRDVGMVFQQFNLFPHLSVLRNVAEAPRVVLKKPAAEAVAEATALLERVGLGDKLHHRPDQLSGGQQQRVAIARALAMKPKLMLFDEPTSALDPKTTKEVLSVMRDLAKDGQGMVVVTHGMEFARQAAHTVYVFQAGKVLESGPPEQIIDAPREPDTAAFLRAVKE
jgi:polar amino acid transport system ATP-binding protein